jgi:hypothetical protein
MALRVALDSGFGVRFGVWTAWRRIDAAPLCTCVEDRSLPRKRLRLKSYRGGGSIRTAAGKLTRLGFRSEVRMGFFEVRDRAASQTSLVLPTVICFRCPDYYTRERCPLITSIVQASIV